jgi:hypothetical protein
VRACKYVLVCVRVYVCVCVCVWKCMMCTKVCECIFKYMICACFYVNAFVYESMHVQVIQCSMYDLAFICSNTNTPSHT